MWKTDYFGIHEKKYKEIREAGEPGWGGDENEKLVQGALDVIQKALQRESVSKTGKLLELGCGDGSVTLCLAKMGFDVHGIDISPTAISWAQEKAKERNIKAEFRVGNVVDLPYPDDFFDIVVDAHCGHCIIGEDRKLFFSEAFRVLRCGGLFIVMTMCADPSDKRYSDPISRYMVRNGIAGRYKGLPEDIMEEIRAAGFHIKHWEVEMASDDEHPDMLNLVAKKSK
jgi:ubiquinone/menaquinone biosynthesis C-methylase UbiE